MKDLLPVLNYRQAAEAVAACLRAKRTALLLGAPGVGKSSLVKDAAAALGLPCYILIASNMDPTDVAGLPYRGPDGHVHRELFPEIRACVEAPGVLCLDEVTTMPKSVEGPLLRVALERNAGGQPLHPDSPVIMCANPPEQAPGGLELSAAMINRVVVLRYAPSIATAGSDIGEISAYFSGDPVRAQASVLSPEEMAAPLRAEMSDFAVTLQADPTLVQLDPPRASIDGGEPWASPRAWEIGLACFAARGGQEDVVGEALLSGAVGPHAALAYLTIRKLRAHLATVEEILADPSHAKIPTEDSYQIAALGVISRVAEVDLWAAYVYTRRLPRIEYAAACVRFLVKRAPKKGGKWQVAGTKAMVTLLAQINSAVPEDIR